MLYENLTEVWSEDSVRYHNTPTDTAKQELLYVQMCGIFRTKAPYSAERAELPSYLLILTTGGSGRICTPGGEYDAKPHTAALIDCRRHHRYYSSEQGWDFIWIHFYGLPPGGFEDFLHNCPPVQPAGDEIISAAERVVKLVSKADAAHERLISAMLSGICSDMMTASYSRLDSETPEYIADFRRKIAAGASDPSASLELAASSMGFSLRHIGREFKKYAGMSPREYLVTVRLNRAKELLKFSDMSVSAVAEKCGIPNTSHFINLFRSREGLTPLKYRAQWRLR